MALRVRVPIAGLLLCAMLGAASGREFTTPSLTLATVDWDGVLTALDKVDTLKKRVATIGSGSPASDGVETIQRLNSATGAVLPNIAASPVPVLLPFDLTGYLRARAEAEESTAQHFSMFKAPTLFLAGPAGYDAAFTFRARDVAEFSGMTFKDDVEIQITGAAFLYALDNTVKLEAKPIELDAQFPGIRRGYLQSHMRYIFVRYGVTYTVSMLCFDGANRVNRLSCREAHPIALRFLDALQLAGGSPQPIISAPVSVERPATEAPGFVYFAPGHLIAGTGYRKHGGRADTTVYAGIRFPLAAAPAHIYSQMFMYSGDCDGVTHPRTTRRGGAPFRCPDNDKTADAVADTPPVFPWRDNFCETRDFSVGQCPSGLGHQGQDIVPAHCAFEGDKNRCDPQRLALVAVHSGTVLRAPGQEALVIVVNTPDAHLRFRYLHMHPKQLDADGMVSGRQVNAGETVGQISNFNGREDGTSHHLHFDMQVLTADGWILVNPYTTLVSAYEALAGGRGLERIDPLSANGAALEESHRLLQTPAIRRPVKAKRSQVSRRRSTR